MTEATGNEKNMEDEKLKILAAFDLETSGLDPTVHDIIEIAIVPISNGRICRNSQPG